MMENFNVRKTFKSVRKYVIQSRMNHSMNLSIHGFRIIIKLLDVLLYFWKTFAFCDFSFSSSFHVDFRVYFDINFTLLLIFFYFLCGENDLSSRFIGFWFIRYTKCDDPVNFVLAIILVIEENSHIDKLSWSDNHHSFVAKIHKLNGY